MSSVYKASNLGTLLKVPPKFPLAQRLAEIVEPFKSKDKISHPFVQSTSIVSPQLCDDALDFLKPSLLARHKGCHILDFLPGPGLWSSKVHELLQPQSHVLIEPDKHSYLPFLQPLLDQPGSKYQLHKLDRYDKVPEQFDIWKLPNGVNGASRPTKNDDILVLATLTRMQSCFLKRSHSDSVTASEQLLYRFVESQYEYSGVNSSGRVRLLAWLYEEDKLEVVPRSIRGRRAKLARQTAVDDITEVIGSEQMSTGKRSPELDLRSSIETARRMKESQISLPSHRQSNIHRLALNSLQPESTLQSDLDELDSLERGNILGTFTKISPEKRPDRRYKNHSPEWSRLQRLRADMYAHLSLPENAGITPQIREVAEIGRHLYELERRLVDPSTPPSDLETLNRDFASFRAQLADRRAPMRLKHVNVIEDVMDETEALRMRPTPIPWNTRPHEPMTCAPSEFWPEHALSLVDFDPRAEPDADAFYRKLFVRKAAAGKRRTVEEALQDVALGAADLVKESAACNDPRVGGRLVQSDLRTRMLTEDMLRQLDDAWEGWAFKVSDDELRADPQGQA